MLENVCDTQHQFSVILSPLCSRITQTRFAPNCCGSLEVKHSLLMAGVQRYDHFIILEKVDWTNDKVAILVVKFTF